MNELMTLKIMPQNMEDNTRIRKKRKSTESENFQKKRSKGIEVVPDTIQETLQYKAGKIQKILVRNFMCHDALEVVFNPNVNFIVGRNGSGKSAVLTALTIGLGARANVTSRGVSVKNFVKNGMQFATIEITLHNRGLMSYKPDIYGDMITVYRRIGNSSAYKLKNWKGEVVSTKRNELDNMLRVMNIQIDNPICILNQDISRTFLVSSKPEEKYQLFMKATLLDVIGNNYREAELICRQEYEKLKQYNEILSEERKEIDQLKEDIRKAEEIDVLREQSVHVEMELYWAIAMSEEAKLQKVEQVFKKCEENVKELQGTDSSMESKDDEINKKIQDIEKEIEDAQQEVTKNSAVYDKTREEYYGNKNVYSIKLREWRSSQSKIKRLEEDLNKLRKEIQRQESGDNTEQSEKHEMKQQLNKLEQKLDEVEAMLRTKQTYQMHLETDKMRLHKEMQASKIEMSSCESRMQKIKRELATLKQQSGNALTIFGRNIPRLLRRIEEEYSNGKFKKKPCGPLGAYIKMKDPAWAPAVENYLGAGILNAFCVDNNNDGKVLNAIMKEIFLNEKSPQVVCCKFYDRVHDVRNKCIRSSTYSNLLDAMVISNPVVANCLIDQREVECVLLIPHSREAAEIMSDASKIPRHCKRAFTQKADTFFPFPHYRSYGGPRGLRSKYLQVSTIDAINSLEEDLRTANNDKNVSMKSYTTSCEKEKRTNSELISVNASVAKLSTAQNQYKTLINDLKDKIEGNETISITIYRNELIELEKKFQKEKAEEASLGEAVSELQKRIQCLEAEVNCHRDLRLNVDAKVEKLKENINQLRDTKEALRVKGQNAVRKLQAVRQALQNATAELEMQQRVTQKAVSNAASKSERVITEKPIQVLARLSRDLKGKIDAIQRQFGSIDQLRAELKEKERKCGKDFQLASKIDKNYQIHLKRLHERKELFSNMKHSYGLSIQNSFTSVLALRNKKGMINIDHSRKILELEVSSQNESKRPVNDTRSLSGGERSYSTVAFILALWDCTGLPFYFLDEFDVFMDKMNRRIIMDILLDHTKLHPQSQFTFLTPLDTSNVFAEDYVTIHQLAPPERPSQMQ